MGGLTLKTYEHNQSLQLLIEVIILFLLISTKINPFQIPAFFNVKFSSSAIINPSLYLKGLHLNLMGISSISTSLTVPVWIPPWLIKNTVICRVLPNLVKPNRTARFGKFLRPQVRSDNFFRHQVRFGWVNFWDPKFSSVKISWFRTTLLRKFFSIYFKKSYITIKIFPKLSLFRAYF